MDLVGRLADELKSKPFAVLEEELTLNLFRTADLLSEQFAQLLRMFDVTSAQYNVLRILRGAPKGLPCGQIAERMVSRDPDVTRLLDRLERAGLIRRERSAQDRRVVSASITREGLKLLERADPFVANHHRMLYRQMDQHRLRQLVELLEAARESISQKERHESNLSN